MFPKLSKESPRAPELRRWARLCVHVRTPLRRGGWYRVLSTGREEVVLEVRGSTVILSRDVVEIVDNRPQVWSFVPAEWGGPYLVCPNCGERTRNGVTTGRMTCP